MKHMIEDKFFVVYISIYRDISQSHPLITVSVPLSSFFTILNCLLLPFAT